MKGTKYMMVFDPHGDMIDPITYAAQRAFKKDFKPQILIHGGDNWDFRNLRKGASDDEKQASLQDDWDAGSDYLRWFFDGGKIKKFLRGNHDERIYDLAGSASGIMRDYANDGVKRLEQLVKRTGAEMFPYDSRLGIMRLGHMKVVHGFFAGRNAASRHAAVFRHVFFGHIHAFYTAPVESDEGPKEARSIGATCKIDMPYNSRQTNKLMHNNGWGYGVMFDDGTYQHWDAKRIGDNFFATENLKKY